MSAAVAALRETSIVFAVAIGVIFLGERPTRLVGLGTACCLVGTLIVIVLGIAIALPLGLGTALLLKAYNVTGEIQLDQGSPLGAIAIDMGIAARPTPKRATSAFSSGSVICT